MATALVGGGAAARTSAQGGPEVRASPAEESAEASPNPAGGRATATSVGGEARGAGRGAVASRARARPRITEARRPPGLAGRAATDAPPPQTPVGLKAVAVSEVSVTCKVGRVIAPGPLWEVKEERTEVLWVREAVAPAAP